MAQYLSKSDFLSRGKMRTYREVVIPELDGQVMVVRSLTNSERDDLEREIIQQKKGGKQEVRDNVRARLLVKAIVDPRTKEPMFNDLEIRELGQINGAIGDRLFQAASELNHIDDEDVDELVKASATDPSEGPGTP